MPATNLLSRKFILVMSALATTTWLCAAGHIHEGVYSAVVISIVGGYIAGNVTQKATATAPAAKD